MSSTGTNGMIRVMKTAAMDAFNESKPCDVVTGVVESVNPIKIRLNQEIILGERQLALTEAVSDYNIEVVLNHATEDALIHTHAITGTKTITIKNGLEVGDSVLMIRKHGGQEFIVIAALERVRKRSV